MLLAAAALAMVPLPDVARAWLAPAHPVTSGWWSSALDPWRTANGVGELLAMLAFGVLAAGWSELRFRRRQVDGALMVGLTVVAAVALAHWAADAQAVFGVWQPRTAPAVLLGPLVNPNHLGALMVLMAPTALAHLLRTGISGPGVWGACLCLVTLVLAGVSRSFGVGLGLAVAGLVVALRGRVPLLRLGMALVVVLWFGWAVSLGVDVPGMSTSITGRSEQWWVSRHIVEGYWFAGAGLNGYEFAYPAFRTHGDLGWYAHAHNDGIEWLSETGLVGLLACMAWVWVWPTATRDVERSVWLDAGLLGFFVVCLVDFPLQVPAVGAAGAMALAVRGALHQSALPANAHRVRVLLASLAVANALAAGVAIRAQVVDSARTAALGWSTDRSAALQSAERLATWDPSAAEIALVRAWEALAEGNSDAAIQTVSTLQSRQDLSASRMRQLALVLSRAGDEERALDWLKRAQDRDPGDYRTALLQARLHTEAGRIDRAMEAWSRTLRLAPPNGGLLDEALRFIPEGIYWSLVLEEADPRWSILLSQRMHRAGDWGAMRAALEVAARDPHWSHQPALGLAMARTGDAAKGLEYALHVTRDRPDDVNAWLYLGRVHLELGQPADARDAFLRVASRDSRARVEAVRAAYTAEGQSGAEALLTRFTNTGLVDDRLTLERARVLMREGEWAACVSVIEVEGLTERASVSDEAKRLAARCEEMRLP